MNTASQTETRQRAPAITTCARIILGLLFLVSGVNGLFHLFPMPPLPERAQAFVQALADSGYFFPLHRTLEVAVALLLLSGRLLPLALVATAPFVVNIALFHFFRAPGGIPVVLVMVPAWLCLAWRHRAAFAPMLRARPSLSAARTRPAELALALVFLASAVMAVLGRTPPPSTAAAAALLEGMNAAGYLFPLLIGTHLVAATLLMARRFVPLALTLLAATLVDIVAYRLFVHTPGMLLQVAAIVGIEGWLAWVHRDAFAPLFRGQPRRVAPAPQAVAA